MSSSSSVKLHSIGIPPYLIISIITLVRICSLDATIHRCGTSSGGQHQEQLNPRSSKILDDPSCVSRVAITSIRKKKENQEKDHERHMDYASWNHHYHHRRHPRVRRVLGFPA